MLSFLPSPAWLVAPVLALSSAVPAHAQTSTPSPTEAAAWEAVIPAKKNLSPEWLASLDKRGEPRVYSGPALKLIGMPVGGFFAGQLYIGGDGRLWHWDIQNDVVKTWELHYEHPMDPEASRIRQGFAVRVTSAGKSEVRSLDQAGFKDTTFLGQYPIATINYADAAFPVSVKLEAFSPFVPLDLDHSSYPGTILDFTVKNTSSAPAEVELGGWLDNIVARRSLLSFWGQQENRLVTDRNGKFMNFSVSEPKHAKSDTAPARPDILVADFESDTWQGWTTTGDAFGTGPTKDAPYGIQQLADFQGRGVANSWSQKNDKSTGTLTSAPFRIDRKYINFLIGGGKSNRFDGRIEVGMNLLVDGKIVRSATGADSDTLTARTWDVSDLEGRQAVLQAVDDSTEGWGHVDVDQIVQSDRPAVISASLADQFDVGTMGLGLLGNEPSDRVLASIPADEAQQIFTAPTSTEASKTTPTPLVGGLVRKLSLQPGQSAKVTFILTWNFPNLTRLLMFMPELKPKGNEVVEKGRYYATKFPSAAAVFDDMAGHYKTLSDQTHLWRDTWYDSTLPFWFLDRTFLNISILATSTALRFADGRFWGWEGVGSCGGNCTNVWSYEQAMGRLFPEADILLRDRSDYKAGVGFIPETGAIRFRSDLEWYTNLSYDGQAGTILRTYRDYLVSPDNALLKRHWPEIKKAVQWMINYDTRKDGLGSPTASNTLDATWFGKVPWLASLYIASLEAGEQMAKVMGDREFAATCHSIAETGKKNFVPAMWNGDYFEQIPEPGKESEVGAYNGCEIDQVLGQSWAMQVGLDRVVPEAETKKALEALWKYNFTTDVGPFRKAFPPGRWFAMPGEGGLVMCAWPRGTAMRRGKNFDYYFNENMTGFEHQVAAHMIWEGMVRQGLAVEKAIDDRYDPLKRNPWNEVECGDHYSRAMASYGVFLAACGFSYDGPAGQIGFAPKIHPEDFRAAFVGAEGWGSFEQKITKQAQSAQLTVKWGKLSVKTVSLAVSAKPMSVQATLNGRMVDCTSSYQDGALKVSLPRVMTVLPGQLLVVSMTL